MFITNPTRHDRDDQGRIDVHPGAREELSASIEQVLMAARPRLVRFAAAQDVASDAVEDVVQETLIEAWRHLSQLSILFACLCCIPATAGGRSSTASCKLSQFLWRRIDAPAWANVGRRVVRIAGITECCVFR